MRVGVTNYCAVGRSRADWMCCRFHLDT